MNYHRYLALFLALLILAPSVSAFGYGTSAISYTQSSATLAPEGAASVGYNVTIASGNTWGTSVNIVNNAQLAGAGITVTLSNPGGDQTNPPFNGTMHISVASTTAAGNYQIVLNATGDDPSVSNAVFTLTVSAPGASSTTTVVGGMTTSVAQLSTTTCCVASQAPSGSGVSTPDAFLVILALVIIGTVISLAMEKSTPSRLIVISVALILIGTFVWLYGDYTGGALQYVWAGVILILIGTILWVWVDHEAHMV